MWKWIEKHIFGKSEAQLWLEQRRLEISQLEWQPASQEPRTFELMEPELGFSDLREEQVKRIFNAFRGFGEFVSASGSWDPRWALEERREKLGGMHQSVRNYQVRYSDAILGHLTVARSYFEDQEIELVFHLRLLGFIDVDSVESFLGAIVGWIVEGGCPKEARERTDVAVSKLMASYLWSEMEQRSNQVTWYNGSGVMNRSVFGSCNQLERRQGMIAD